MTDQKIITPLENNTLTQNTITQYTHAFKIYLNKIYQFKPISLQLKELNPLLQPNLSVPCLLLSLIVGRYYRQKYFLIKASTIRLFSVGLNYSIYYYLLTNGIELFNHLNSKEEAPVSLDSNQN